jgi:hypothetical protein
MPRTNGQWESCLEHQMSVQGTWPLGVAMAPDYDQLVRDLVVERLCPHLQKRAGLGR